jgi:hypothetical protein
MLLKIPGFGKILGNIGGVFRGDPGDRGNYRGVGMAFDNE